MKFFRECIKKNIYAVYMVLMVAVFPALFLYLQNSGQAGFGEIVKPLFLLMGIGVLFLGFCYMFIKNINKAALAAAIFVVALGNYKGIEKIIKIIFKSLRYWHILPVLLLIIILLSDFVVRNMPDDFVEIVVKVVGLVVTGLVLINFITAIPGMVKYVQSNRQIAEAKKEQEDAATNTNLPNIYLLLFDEYSSIEQMKRYYGYDNKVLTDYLEEHYFNVSNSSHNEYYATDICVTNLMNLEYLVMPSVELAEAEKLRKNGTLYSKMRELGYKVQVIEVADFLGQESPTRDKNNNSAGTVNGETLTDLCLKQTVLYPFVQGYTNASVSEIVRVCDYLSSSENIPQESTFTVFYVGFPHHPFLVDENGEKLPSSAYVNWENDDYYLGQYKYCTKLMINILDNLVTHDPDSVIFLQSDHGARASGSDLFGIKFTPYSMTQFLNAVYVKGKDIDYIEGKSAINTVRLVLDDLFQLNLGEVEVPRYVPIEE